MVCFSTSWLSFAISKILSNPYLQVIRISALECLEVICKYPVFVVQPYKVDVILELASPLDDKKRLVRNAAVKTRNAWFLIGTDTSKDNK